MKRSMAEGRDDEPCQSGRSTRVVSISRHGCGLGYPSPPTGVDGILASKGSRETFSGPSSHIQVPSLAPPPASAGDGGSGTGGVADFPSLALPPASTMSVRASTCTRSVSHALGTSSRAPRPRPQTVGGVEPTVCTWGVFCAFPLTIVHHCSNFCPSAVIAATCALTSAVAVSSDVST